MQHKGKPPEADSLQATSEGFESEAETLPKKMERYSRARERAVDIITHVIDKEKETGNPLYTKVVRGLTTCGNYLHFRDYFTVGKVRLHSARFCKKHLFCPLCAIRRASKTLQAYLPKYQLIMSENANLTPYMITITVKNGTDLLERYNHLVKSIQVLTRKRTRSLTGSRDKTEFSKLFASVGSYEFTNKGKGWHPHVHILALCTSEPDQWALSKEWIKATGDSYIVDVRPIDNISDPIRGFLEVFKYALKFSDLTPFQHVEAASILNGRRMMFSLGKFRGITIPENLLDEPLEGLPYHDLIYDFMYGSGYHYRN